MKHEGETTIEAKEEKQVAVADQTAERIRKMTVKAAAAAKQKAELVNKR
jgi:hypothetical protein